MLIEQKNQDMQKYTFVDETARWIVLGTMFQISGRNIYVLTSGAARKTMEGKTHKPSQCVFHTRLPYALCF